MKTAKRLLLGLALMGLTPAYALAQTSSVSSAATTASTAASSPQAAQAMTLWGLIAQIPPALKKCKAKFCASCCGDLVNNMLKPLSMMTGGCLKCCPDKPSADDLAKPGAGGACALIRQDTIEAKSRLEAVRCLAAVDCNYWPEAEKGLIDALRADKNECVRLYAALALGNGCCCTANTIAALKLSATGGTADGNPPESSRRVRAVALRSLNHCLACRGEPQETIPPERPVPPEQPIPPGAAPTPMPTLTPVPAPPPPAAAPGGMSAVPSANDPLMAEMTRLMNQPNVVIMDESYTTLSEAPVQGSTIVMSPQMAGQPQMIASQQMAGASQPLPPTGKRSVLGIFRNSYRQSRRPTYVAQGAPVEMMSTVPQEQMAPVEQSAPQPGANTIPVAQPRRSLRSLFSRGTN